LDKVAAPVVAAGTVRPALDNAHPAAFRWPLRIYWEDTDAGGIVFYANYLKFFERSRTEWLRSLGIEQQALRESSGGMFVVTETSVRYHRPARLDDALIVTARLIEKGRASLIIGQSALLKSEQSTVLLCEGTIRIGWVDAASLKPARIPAHLLDRLETTT
jgi:acyl-CoA thioester hydrolase